MKPLPNTRPSLLVRVRDANDIEGWRQFETVYGELILRYCRRRGMQLADAEDIRQVVLFKLARALRQFEYDPAKGRFRDYLGRCVRNAIAGDTSRHKSAKSTVSLFKGEDIAPADQNGDAEWHAEWVQHHYRRAVRTLRQTCEAQTVEIFNAIVEGADYAEIARKFDTSEVAVRKIKQRMRDRLRQIVAEQVQDEEVPRNR